MQHRSCVKEEEMETLTLQPCGPARHLYVDAGSLDLPKTAAGARGG